MDNQMKILCIHGYMGKADNTTFRKTKELHPEAEVISKDFDLLDIQAVYGRIAEINPDIIVANSLGGFYALTWQGDCKRIVVNPCLVPSVEIPKLDGSVPEYVVDAWKEIEGTWDKKSNLKAFGIFAKDDELFHYKEMFDSKLGGPSSSSSMVEGTHKLKDPGLTEGLAAAFEFVRETC